MRTLVTTTDESTLYDVLGLNSTADTDEIGTPFRKLIRVIHPDVAGMGEAAAILTRRLTKALDTLSAPARSRAYDELLVEPDPESEVNPAEPVWQPGRPAYAPPTPRLPSGQRKLLLNSAWISTLKSTVALGVGIWFGLGPSELVLKPQVTQ